jgi:exodeoxyribonuclease VII small subunit
MNKKTDSGNVEITENAQGAESFEDIIFKLQNIIDELDSDNIRLADGMKKFEEGILLSEKCLKILNSGKGRLLELKKQLDGLSEIPLDFEEC